MTNNTIRDGTDMPSATDVATASTVREDAQHTDPWAGEPELIRRARHATTALREAARLGAVIEFRQRDPLVRAIHDALDCAAAAPDMYDACKKARAALGALAISVVMGQPLGPLEQRVNDAQDALIAAIAKAEGRA